MKRFSYLFNNIRALTLFSFVLRSTGIAYVAQHAFYHVEQHMEESPVACKFSSLGCLPIQVSSI